MNFYPICLCTSVTHHQAQPQPPTIVLFESVKQPPDITMASFGPLVQTFPMTAQNSSKKITSKHFKKTSFPLPIFQLYVINCLWSELEAVYQHRASQDKVRLARLKHAGRIPNVHLRPAKGYIMQNRCDTWRNILKISWKPQNFA